MRTLYSQSRAVSALAYAVRNSNEATDGIAIDLAAFGNNSQDVTFVVYTATVTDGTHTVTVEESDSSGEGFAAVPASRVQGTLPAIVAANDDTVFQFGVRPTKRYVRIVVTDASSTTGAGIGAVALLGAGSNNPPVRA